MAEVISHIRGLTLSTAAAALEIWSKVVKVITSLWFGVKKVSYCVFMHIYFYANAEVPTEFPEKNPKDSGNTTFYFV